MDKNYYLRSMTVQFVKTVTEKLGYSPKAITLDKPLFFSKLSQI